MGKCPLFAHRIRINLLPTIGEYARGIIAPGTVNPVQEVDLGAAQRLTHANVMTMAAVGGRTRAVNVVPMLVVGEDERCSDDRKVSDLVLQWPGGPRYLVSKELRKKTVLSGTARSTTGAKHHDHRSQFPI